MPGCYDACQIVFEGNRDADQELAGREKMTIKEVIHTNEAGIDRVLKVGLPLLLVFWDPKSPPGESDVQLDQIARDYSGRTLVVKINGAEELQLARRFQVQHLPAFVFVKEQKVEATLPGSTPAHTLRDWLNYLTERGARPAQPTPTEAPTNRHSASGQPIHLTDRNFEQIVKGDLPVLVDFWAEWCGPCRMVAPTVEQLAREFQGRAVVGKLNVDENPQTARRFGIMSIPALYIFKKGEVADRTVGVQPLPVMRQWLSRHVK
jgi:thioredoxin 1